MELLAERSFAISFIAPVSVCCSLELLELLLRLRTMQLGAFTKQAGGVSDEAKQLWSTHLGFSQGRLDMSAGIGGGRLQSAPPLPKLGGPDDPGRMLKDWNFYKYRPHVGLSCSLNKYGPDFRWPGINNTPALRHHLAVVQRPKPSVELDHRTWTDLPRLDPGPGHTYILKREADAKAVEERRIQNIHQHIKTMKHNLNETVSRREMLQSRAFAEPAFGDSGR